MAASYQTIDEVISVIKRYVNEETFLKILTDLRKVKGNSSFETTIQRMHLQAVKEHAKRGPS